MMSNKPVIDEETQRKAIDEIVHGTFLMEGTMVAFPLCFPGVTVPLPPDESHITALTLGPDALVYGCTGGHQAHLIVGMFHGLTGMVYDLGSPVDATEGVAVGCTNKQVIAAFNGPNGGSLVRREVHGLPFDLIQEWGFSRPPLDELGGIAEGERIIDGIMLDNDTFIVSGEQHLAMVNVSSGVVTTIGELPQPTCLARTDDGCIVGIDGNTLWCYSAAGGFIPQAIILPAGAWHGLSLRWAHDAGNSLLYLADDDGQLYRYNTATGFSACLGQIPQTPVGPMAVTYDGRLFGACGSELANLFCYDPAVSSMRSLGVAASVIERRRYGYAFGAAIVGRDGEIVFGEDDNLGHMWLYFPRIMKHR
ncbi:MAG: hypothetical protein ACYCZF_06510 [Anaerolineae bacterium]